MRRRYICVCCADNGFIAVGRCTWFQESFQKKRNKGTTSLSLFPLVALNIVPDSRQPLRQPRKRRRPSNTLLLNVPINHPTYSVPRKVAIRRIPQFPLH